MPSQPRLEPPQRSVPSAQATRDSLHLRASPGRLFHHSHNACKARILRQSGCLDYQCRVAIDRSRDHGRARSFGDVERLACKQRFIHVAVALNDNAIGWTELVRKYDEAVADLDLR
jgi:hypothetical protein